MISSESSRMSRIQVISLGAEKQGNLGISQGKRLLLLFSVQKLLWSGIPRRSSSWFSFRQQNSPLSAGKFWDSSEFFQGYLYWHVDLKTDGLCRGEILFTLGTGKRGVRKHVCVTQACIGSVQGAICEPSDEKRQCLCSGAAREHTCIPQSSFHAEDDRYLTRLLLCVGWNSAYPDCHTSLLWGDI